MARRTFNSTKKTSSSSSSKSSGSSSSSSKSGASSSQLDSMKKQLEGAQKQLDAVKASQAPKTTTSSPIVAPKTSSSSSSSSKSSGGSSNSLGVNAVTPKSTSTSLTLPSSQTKSTGLVGTSGQPFTMPKMATSSANSLTIPASGLSSMKGLSTTPQKTGLVGTDGKPVPVPKIDTSGKGALTLQALATQTKQGKSSGGGSSRSSSGGSTTQQNNPSPYYQPATGAQGTQVDNSAMKQDLMTQLESLQGELGTLQKAQAKGYTGDSTGAQNFLTNYKRPEKLAGDSTYPNDKQAVNPNSTTQQGFLQSLADRTNASAAFTTLNADIEKLKEKIAQSKIAYAKQSAALQAEPGTIQYKQGKDRLLQQQYQNEQTAMGEQANAISEQIAGLNTQQGLQIGAAQAGAGFTAPQMQFGQLTNPQTGQVIGADATGNNPLLTSAVQNAYTMLKSGTSYADAVATLSQFGQKGEQMLLSALMGSGTGFNMTANNAIAGQNVAQGALYQGQATELSKTLQQLDLLQPVANNFLEKSGLNNINSPNYNKNIKTTIYQTGSAADITSWNAISADIKTYTAQILGNSGLNPTEVSATVNSFDPADLSPAQLNAFLTNLKNLGQIRLAPLQGSSQASYGVNGGYMGAPANTAGQYQFTGSMGVGNASGADTVNATAGFLMNLVNTPINLVSSFLR